MLQCFSLLVFFLPAAIDMSQNVPQMCSTMDSLQTNALNVCIPFFATRNRNHYLNGSTPACNSNRLLQKEQLRALSSLSASVMVIDASSWRENTHLLASARGQTESGDVPLFIMM